MGGSSAASPNVTEVTGVQIGTSCYGKPLPVGFGTNRLAGNVFWMPPELFVKEAGSSGGKGGGGGYSSDQYWQGFAIALCEGPIGGIGKVWRDKDVFQNLASVEQSGSPFQFFSGTRPQTPWSFFSAIAPDRKSIAMPVNATTTINDSAFTGVVEVTGTRTKTVQTGPSSGGPAPDGYTLTKVTGTPGVGQYKVTGNQVQVGPTAGGTYDSTTVSVIYKVTSAMVSQGLGYGGTAYVISQKVSLGSSNSMKNYSFETTGRTSVAVTNGVVNPADVIADIMADTSYGFNGEISAQVATGQDGLAASSYSRWCAQAGYMLAPFFEEQKPFLEHLQWMLDASNAGCVWSEGVLKIVPYGDKPDGAYTPAFWNAGAGTISPLYNITETDIILDDQADDRIKVTRKSVEDTFNDSPVEYLDRTQADDGSKYNTSTISDLDQADYARTNNVRTAEVLALRCVTDAAVAQKVSRFRTQRSLNHANTYDFKVGPRHMLLEPLDFVTVTDSKLGLNNALVRIVSVDEDENFCLTISAEEWKLGVGTPPKYVLQPPSGGGANVMADPYNAMPPVVVAPPRHATGGVQELWVGTSGAIKDWGGAQVLVSFDGGATYQNFGEVGRATYGKLVTSVAAGNPLDTTTTLQVDLSASQGTLASVDDASRDNLDTLCVVENELLSFRNAALVSGSTYNLTSLRRGVSGTVSVAHNGGAGFLRVDSNVVKIEVPDRRLGYDVLIKLVSFNIDRRYAQTVASAPVFVFSLPARKQSYEIVDFPVIEPFDQFNIDDWDVFDANTPGSVAVVVGAGQRGGNVLRCTGMVTLVSRKLLAYDPTRMVQLFARVRCYQQPTVGGQRYYLGFAGVAADGSTYVNMTGLDSIFGQHYMASTLPGTSAWVEQYGYWQGSAATGTGAGTVGAPGKFHQDVRYLRPVLYIGYDSPGDAITDVDHIEIVQNDPVAVAAYNASAGSGIHTFYQATAPTAISVGDLWFETDNAYYPYRWDGAVWQPIHDATPLVASQVNAGFVTAGMLQVGIVGGGNLLLNSAFKGPTHPVAHGDIPDGWNEYNNGGEACTYTVAAGGPAGTSYSRCAWTVLNSVTRGLYTTSATTLANGKAAGIQGGYRRNQWYVVSFYAHAEGSSCQGQPMGLVWNFGPDDTVWLANPALINGWQRYSVKVRWTSGTPDTGVYITLAANVTNGVLSLAGMQVEEGEVPTSFKSAEPANITTGSIRAIDLDVVDINASGVLTVGSAQFVGTLPVAKVSGTLPASQVGSGITDSQITSIDGSKIVSPRIQTTNFGTGASGYPNSGAKLDSLGTALLVAPHNLQVGPLTLEQQLNLLLLGDISRWLSSQATAGYWVALASTGSDWISAGSATALFMNGTSVAWTSGANDGDAEEGGPGFLCCGSGANSIVSVTRAGVLAVKSTSNPCLVICGSIGRFPSQYWIATRNTLSVNTALWSTDSATFASTTLPVTATWQGACCTQGQQFLLVGNDASNNVVACYGFNGGWSAVTLPSNTGGTVSGARSATAGPAKGVVCGILPDGHVFIATAAYLWYADIGSNLSSAASWTRVSSPFGFTPYKCKSTPAGAIVTALTATGTLGCFIAQTVDSWRQIIIPAARNGGFECLGVGAALAGTYHGAGSRAQFVVLAGTAGAAGSVYVSGAAPTYYL